MMRGAALLFLAFVLLGSQLMVGADWPAACDPHADRRFELVTAYGCSPHLLSGGPRDIAAFIFLWALPLSIAALFIYGRKHLRARTVQNSVE